MYVALEKFQEALAAFDFAIISDDRFSGAYYEKGYVLEKLGRYNEAIENYEFCFEWDAPTPQAYLRIGYCHQKLGNHSLAEQYFYKTVHLDPLLDKGWLALTKYYFVSGDLLKAQEHINKALNIDGENALYWRRAAHIYHSLGEIEKADYAFEQSIELGNFEFNSYLKWISIQLEQKDYSRAIECLLEALEHHPEEAALLFIKSGIHALLDERDEAQNTLCQAMRLDSSAADYFYFYFEEMSELDWLKSYLEKKEALRLC
jgi:tetratricopeptide (TPR) repeat protein